MCGGIQWSSLGVGNSAVVGYNSRGNYFSNHPFSGFSQISDALSCTFSSRRRQRRQSNRLLAYNNLIFLSTNSTLNSRMRMCSFLKKLDIGVLNSSHQTPMGLANLLLHCPPTIRQAERDCARFIRLNNRPDDARHNNYCFVSADLNSHRIANLGEITLTQMCCYNRQGYVCNNSPSLAYSPQGIITMLCTCA